MHVVIKISSAFLQKSQNQWSAAKTRWLAATLVLEKIAANMPLYSSKQFVGGDEHRESPHSRLVMLGFAMAHPALYLKPSHG